ncbi:cyclin-dependent kinase 11A-like [Strongylocentrotus purpuratus]|uniref:Torsin-1A-interacting protein 1/2 AAA+ activator domain-containing protein n=1 Tax=Strongylocentrotus purpuratus TaxID=7668 RepID=A0A7M7PSC1_STRPU|nr:cyclin-dependent kinase 11A-like [Strongylocentrotus purpuratus]
MSDLTDAAVTQSEEGVTEPKELGGQSSTSMDTKVVDFVAVDAKGVTPEESTTSESMSVDGISQASNIQASGEEEEQDGPGDGSTAEVQEEKVKGAMSDVTDAAVTQSEEGVTKPQELGGQFSTSTDTKDDDWVAVDAKDIPPEESTTSESMSVDGISQASNIQASGEKEEKDGPGDGGTAEVQEEKKVKGAMEDDGGEQERMRVEEEEKQREEEKKRAEEEKQREEEKKREEEEKQREKKKIEEEERRREEEMKAKKVKIDEDRQREGSAQVEELQKEGEGTDEADQAIGTETIPTPAEVSEGTELTRRKVASKDTPRDSATDQGESKGPAPSSDGSIWKYGSIVVLISISVFIAGFIIFPKAPPPAPDETAHSDMGDCLRKRSEREDVLYEEIESLSKKFPSLDQPSLETIGGASWAHVQDKEELVRPVVLLLVSQPDHVKANDVAEEVANMYSNVYHKSRGDIVRVDGDDFEDGTADQVKKDIDAKIKSGLNGCASVVIIKDLDELQPCSIILFHGYCDNDGAPYKDAVFIFTMTLDDTIPEDTSKLETEKIIQEHLEQHLRQCPEEFPKDKIAAMNSRLANNIVMLN